jgi:two-component sensor histidine kinase
MSREEIECVTGVFKSIAAAQKPFKELENTNLHKDGHEVILETSGVPIFDADGKFQGYRGIDRDITNRKKDEERVKVSLREKEILLRELYHRTKNNMQVISSLLNLQSLSIDDENVLNIFRETQNRIRSIALVHEKLYQSNDLSNINLGDYIHDMTGTLFMSYGMSDKVSLNLDADTVITSIDTAIPCGLIINELITNSLKYAFPGNKKGSITVAVNSADETVELRISDNGIGLPKEFDFKSAKSLGLKLIRQLTENQLHGKISCKSEKGVEFIIQFKNETIPTMN